MAGTTKVIVAIDENYVIGTHDGKLPWKLAADLRMFKIITMGENVVMGSNTYKSIPGKLKDRTVHVLSKTMTANPNEYVLHKSMASINKSVQDPFIIGGVTLYDKYIPTCDELYVTRVCCTVKGSNKALKRIKPINFDRFHLVEEYAFLNKDKTENEYPFVIQKYMSKRYFNKTKQDLSSIISPELSVYEDCMESGEFWHNKQGV